LLIGRKWALTHIFCLWAQSAKTAASERLSLPRIFFTAPRVAGELSRTQSAIISTMRCASLPRDHVGTDEFASAEIATRNPRNGSI